MKDTPRLRALTLWPEWAWAIHHLDKRVENRTWALPTGQWFALHAGKYIGGRSGAAATIEGIEAVCEMASRAGWFYHGTARTAEFCRVADAKTAVWEYGDVQTSAILGLFRVTRADPPNRGDLTGWRVPEQVGNVFEYQPLAAPIPCSGAQGLWRVPEDIAARVRAGAP